MLRRLIITTGQRLGPNLIPTIHPIVIVLTAVAVACFGAPLLSLIVEVAWNLLTGLRNRLMLLASPQFPSTS